MNHFHDSVYFALSFHQTQFACEFVCDETVKHWGNGMIKLKFYQFAIALATAIPLSATSAQLSMTYAAPAAAAIQLKDPVDSNAIEVQRRHRVYRYHNNNRWVGPAITLGVVGVIAGIAANQRYYAPQYGYYQQPYVQPYYQQPYAQPYGYYYQQPRRRCFIVNELGRGYDTWC